VHGTALYVDHEKPERTKFSFRTSLITRARVRPAAVSAADTALSRHSSSICSSSFRTACYSADGQRTCGGRTAHTHSPTTPEMLASLVCTFRCPDNGCTSAIRTLICPSVRRSVGRSHSWLPEAVVVVLGNVADSCLAAQDYTCSLPISCQTLTGRTLRS
jgi:hypothetical protein